MHSVTAIVVAHDGARWLKETLDAVLRQSRPLDRVAGVDNGSRDGSGRLLAEAFGQGSVLSLPRSAGFGEAVHEVVRRLPRAQGQEWLWLLHDDCAPDPHALSALLRAADENPKAAILGPKLRDWLDRRVLLEIGVTVGRSGRRDTGLEPREYDQGQHDGPHGVVDVLSVSTAGMLIRRDVWEELAGLDPVLPLFRDDLDLCWRARIAGHRVLNVTTAVAWHAEAASRRRRRIAVSDDHPRRLDRRNGLFVIIANLPFLALVRSIFRNIAGSLARTVLFLLAKQPANALDELAALGSVLGRPGRLIKARRARKKGRKQGYPAVARLLTPPGATWRRLADMVQRYLAGEGPVDSAGRHHAAGAAEDDGDELLTDSGLFQRITSSPGVLLFLLLAGITVAAAWPLLTGGGLLGGGALVPVTGGASDLWRLYTENHHVAGLGSDTWAPPYVAVIAALSTLFFGNTALAVSVLLLGCVPLAGLSAYVATRRMISYTPARVWLAATYALLPVATGVIATGRVGTALILILIPGYVALATRVVAGSRRAAWGFGLLLAVGAAFDPLVYVMVAILGGLAAVSFGGIRRGVGLSLGIGLGTPIVLLFPWLVEIVREPRRILLESGLADPALADPRVSAEALLMFNPGGPGTPPVWVTGGLVAVALGALLLRRHQTVVAIGWGVTLFGVLLAVVVGRLGEWPGVPLAFAATGLLVATALTAHRIAEFRAAGVMRRLGALLIVVVAFATPLAAAGLWIAGGAGGPLRGDLRDPLPPLAAAFSPRGERTLLMRPEGGRLTYTILPGRAPLIGESDLRSPEADTARVGAAVAGLASGRGGDDVRTLAAYGIQFVTAPGPVEISLQRALDSEPALARMSLSEVGGLWRVVGTVTVPRPPAGGDGWHRTWLWAQAALVALVLLLASPGARTAEQYDDHGDAPEPARTSRRRPRNPEERVPA
ncbi:glycosyltransferase family 2 protein [Microtetraspora malaysiensis]|uniref:glycosyltransferase family 2 protein n=1 Tax=Microtetraspora malaysiensis TaxID=161358 RepID=UPI00082AE228|nr:glycosyltransferase family 2 protein [Microtetraspora malaysiensis]